MEMRGCDIQFINFFRCWRLFCRQSPDTCRWKIGSLDPIVHNNGQHRQFDQVSALQSEQFRECSTKHAEAPFTDVKPSFAVLRASVGESYCLLRFGLSYRTHFSSPVIRRSKNGSVWCRFIPFTHRRQNELYAVFIASFRLDTTVFSSSSIRCKSILHADCRGVVDLFTTAHSLASTITDLMIYKQNEN